MGCVNIWGTVDRVELFLDKGPLRLKSHDRHASPGAPWRKVMLLPSWSVLIQTSSHFKTKLEVVLGRVDPEIFRKLKTTGPRMTEGTKVQVRLRMHAEAVRATGLSD